LQRVLGKFRLVERVCETDGATVWRGERAADFDPAVAIELYDPADSAGAANAHAKQRALGMLNHPTIPALVDASFSHEGPAWVAAEWREGKPLPEYCASRQLMARQIVLLLRQLLDALLHAHQRFIVHGRIDGLNVITGAFLRQRQARGDRQR